MNYYVERGYVPMGAGTKGMHRAGAAQTLEYAYSDWCLGQFAKALGKKEDESPLSETLGELEESVRRFERMDPSEE